MHVCVHYHAAAEGAQETVRRIEAAGGSAEIFAADLTAAGAPERLIHDVLERTNTLDVLVNSAAVMLRMLFGTITAEQWDQVFALNLRAPFLLAQAAAPALARARGCIINIADLAAFETWPAYVPHGISKRGVVQMTRALARVLAPEVRVNAIAPGAVLLPDHWTEADAERLSESTPLGTLGEPSDVTQAMLYLLDARYVTGETMIVDGGRHIRR
jgi:pteridine reductase